MPELGQGNLNPLTPRTVRKPTIILEAGHYENAEKMRETDATEIIIRNITRYLPVMTANEIDFYSGIIETRATYTKREATRKCRALHPKRRV